MAGGLGAPIPLSITTEHLSEHVQPDLFPGDQQDEAHVRRPDSELRSVYEIPRTADEIRRGRWATIALQFPDSMLGDASWVVRALGDELETPRLEGKAGVQGVTDGVGTTRSRRIYILADTSYSACCVDELAAEHVHAEVIVHYGRSCLSPTSRHPVIHVFTTHQLDHDATVDAIQTDFPAKDARMVLMADVTYQSHVPKIASDLRQRGYANLLATEVIHDPVGMIPNRRIVGASGRAASPHLDLHSHEVFHISEPPLALLLALSSRVSSLHILPTGKTGATPTLATDRTRALLGRRYARILSVASASIIGILVNTLSVANYLRSIEHIRQRIAAAGKKSYTVVVGKLNPAKLANFTEVDGWVVIGCWESSLVEDDGGFFKPVITPFELEVALVGDEKRVWGGEWWGGIEGVQAPEERQKGQDETSAEMQAVYGRDQDVDGVESEPPEFDLRSGRLRRMMRMQIGSGRPEPEPESQASEAGATSAVLAPRPKAEVTTVKGVVSPGADYLRSQRTWSGLGSDAKTSEKSTVMQQGQSGVARGYTVDALADSERR